MTVTLEAFGLDKLTTADKQELIALLEDSVADESGDFVMTPSELAELERRVAAARANPGGGTPWEEVRDAALARSRARQAGQ